MATDKIGAVNRKSVFSAIDLVPSLLKLASVTPPADVQFDGMPLPNVLLGQSDGSRTRPLFFRRPADRDAFYGVANLPDLAVRDGRWKLLCEYDGSDARLYDLDADPSETKNLAMQHPDTVKRLSKAVIAWHKSLPPNQGASQRSAPAKNPAP